MGSWQRLTDSSWHTSALAVAFTVLVVCSTFVGPAGAALGTDATRPIDQGSPASTTSSTGSGTGDADLASTVDSFGALPSSVTTWPTLDGTDWGTVGRDPGRSGHTPNSSGPTVEPDARWIYAFSNDQHDLPAVAADGIVYVAGRDSLRAVDNDTGAVVWNNSGIDISSVAVADGLVVTTEIDYSGDEIRVYDAATGTEVWNHTGFQADATVVYDGVVYATRGEYLHAFDLQAGGELWSVDVNEDVSNGLSAANGTLYATGMVNDRDYAVRALDASDGSERWDFEIEGTISMLPVATNGAVYVGGGNTGGQPYDPKVYRLNATDGHVEWVFDVNDRPRGAAVADGAVYVAAGNSIRALDGTSGERLWRHRLSGSLTYGLSYTAMYAVAPVVANGTVYATNNRGHLVALDGATGATRWEYLLDGMATRPAIADDRVYVHAADDGLTTVYALETPPFQFSGYSVSSTSLVPGEAVTAGVTIENVDDETRTYNLSLLADPPIPADARPLDWANGTLSPGATTTLTLDGQIDVSGDWNLSIARPLESESSAGPLTVTVDPATRTDEWPQIAFDGGRTGSNPDTVGPMQHAQEVWNLTNFDDDVRPVIADGTVVAVHERWGSPSSYSLAAYDEATGTEQWSFNVSARDRIPTGSPTVANGTVYLFARPYNFDGTGPNVHDNSLFALDVATGNLTWSRDFTTNESLSIDQAPVVADGQVYVAGAIPEPSGYDANASLRVFDAGTGATVWSDTVATRGESEIYYQVSVADGMVVATLADEDDTGSGTVWDDRLVGFTAGGAQVWSTSGVTIDVQEPPVIRNGTVYAISEDYQQDGDSIRVLHAFNLTDGTERWSFRPTYRENISTGWDMFSPVVTDDAVYLSQRIGLETSSVDSSQLYRIDPASGATVWNRSTSNLLSLFEVGGVLYAGDYEGDDTDLYDAGTGEYYTSTDLLSRGHGTAQAVANGTLISYADSTTPNDFRVIREGGVIEYTDIAVDSHVSGVDENVTVTATATNVGDYAREYDVNLDVSPDDGNAHHYVWNYPNREGLLAPGESTTITWVVEVRERGDVVFTLQPSDPGQDMNMHMYDRAGSATVHVGDARDGQAVDLGSPRDLAPDAGSWPTADFDARNTGNNSLTAGPTAVGNDTAAWIVNQSSEWDSAPTVANDTVYVGGYDGTDDALFAYNATDGSLRWTYPTASAIEIPPVYASGYLYTADSRGRIYQFDAATGDRLWTFHSGDVGGIAVVNGVLYATVDYSTSQGTSEDRLFALNATDREVLWTFAKPSTGYGMAQPAVDDGTVFLTQDGVGTYAVDAATGQQLWNRSIAGSGSRLHSPVVEDGVVYVDDAEYSGTNGHVYALDAADGTTLWSTPANVDGYTGASPALAHDTLYFTADGSLHAVDATTGADVWTSQICGAAEHSPVYADGTVFVPLADSSIRAYDAGTGDMVWQYSRYGYESYTPAIVDGLLYTTGLENSDYTYSLAALSGGTTATAPPLFDYYGLSVSPTNASVGEAVSVSATVENQGSASCTYTANLSVDGAVVDTSSDTLGTGYNDDGTVSFTWTPSTEGIYNVTIEDLAPVEVAVAGPAPEVSVSPSTFSFGDVNVSESDRGWIYVNNDGQRPLDVTGYSLTGVDADEFSFAYGNAPTVVAPGDSHTLAIDFTPTSNGAMTATLDVTTNDTSNSPASATLTGTGVSPPEVDVAPTNLHFGDVEVGANATATVTVSNVGGGPLAFDGATLSGSDAFTVTGGGAAGTIAAGDDRTVTVRFDPAATGPATGTLSLATNDSDEGTVSVSLAGNGTVTVQNRAPFAAADHYVVYEGEWLNVSAPGRLANDLDPEGDDFSGTHHTNPDDGTLASVGTDGSFNYTPDAAFTGTDSFVYRVRDSEGNYSAWAQVTIEVLPDPNRAPIAADDRFSVHAGEWLNVSGPGRLANDRDPDGDDFSASHHGDTDHGTLQRSAQDGSFEYLPDPGFVGTDSYVYRVQDSEGAYSSFATVEIEVLPPRTRAPTVVDDHYTVEAGEWLNVSGPGRLANDYDVDGDDFSASHHGSPSHGTLAWSAQDGSFNYTPDAGFTGTDSYVYRVRDEHGEYSSFGTVEIEVVDGNRAPTVVDDQFAVLEGEWLNVTGPGRLANDYDADGDGFAASHHGDVDNGTLHRSAQDGSFEYLPDPGLTGTDDYVYRVRDDGGEYSAFGTVSIDVIDATATDPVATDDHYTVTEGEWLNVSGPGRLANDLDPDGTFSASHHGSPSHGTLARSAQDGSFEYLPEEGFVGTDTFVYRVQDDDGNYSSYATVTIEVVPDPNASGNRAPAVEGDHYTVTEGEWLNVSGPGRLANDYDLDGDDFSASHQGSPDHGTLYRSAQDGSFQYLPDPGFTGIDDYVYRVRDEHGEYSEFNTVTIEVVPDPNATANRRPIAIDDHYTVFEGEWLNVSGPGRLANDADPDGDEFDASHHGGVDNGTLAWSAQDGSFEYRPDDGFTGTDSYVYRIQDEHGEYSSFATVEIEVLPDPNRAPATVPDDYVVLQGETLTVNAPGRLANDYDLDGDDFAASHHGSPDHGTLDRSAQDGSLEYTPDPGFTGVDDYVYRVRDEHGVYSGFEPVTITVVDASTSGNADVAIPGGPIDFGSVSAGTTALETLTVANVGDLNLTVSGATITGPDAADFAVGSGNDTAVLGYGATTGIVVEYTPTAVGDASATLTVHSDDPEEGTVNVTLSGTGEDDEPPTIDAVALSGSFVDDSDPNGSAVSENETATIEVDANDLYGSVRDVRVTLEARSATDTASQYATVNGTTGNWTAAMDVSSLAEDEYEVTIRATDDSWNRRTITANDSLVVDRTSPPLAASLSLYDGTHANVTVRTSDAIRSGTLAVEIEHNGSVETVAMTGGDGRWNGTFQHDGDGAYNLSATATDLAGNRGTDTARARFVTANTTNNTITVEMEPSGLFVQFNTDEPINDTYVSMTESSVPVEPLVRGQVGVQFLDAVLGERLTGNLTYATIGIPVDASLLPSGTDPADVTIRYFNESTGQWSDVKTTVENVTIDGTTDQYWVATAVHFSTYGAVAADLTPPVITATSPTDGGELAAGTTATTLRFEFEDPFSGVDPSATAVQYDGSVVTGDAATTITSDAVEFVATGLTDGSSHEFEVTVEDRAGNVHVETVTFSVASPAGGSGSGGSGGGYGFPAPEASFDVLALDGGFLLEITDAVSGEALSTTVENGALDATGVSIEHLTVTFAEDGDRDLWMTAGPSTTGSPLPSSEGDVLAYLSVPDGEVTTATLQFSVADAALTERGADPEDVRLFQRQNGAWTPIDVRSVSTSDTVATFEADIVAFGTVAVATVGPDGGATGGDDTGDGPDDTTGQDTTGDGGSDDGSTDGGTGDATDESPSDSAGSSSGSGGQPGFDVTAVVIALLALFGLWHRRRRFEKP